jgi:hypothetical protein
MINAMLFVRKTKHTVLKTKYDHVVKALAELQEQCSSIQLENQSLNQQVAKQQLDILDLESKLALRRSNRIVSRHALSPFDKLQFYQR